MREVGKTEYPRKKNQCNLCAVDVLHSYEGAYHKYAVEKKRGMRGWGGWGGGRGSKPKYPETPPPPLV